MQQELNQSIISTANSTFVEMVESNLMQGKPLVALLRYSHHGGAHEYFLLRSRDDFQFVLRKSRPKDALTFFFELSFPVSGFVTSELKDKALSYLDAILENGEEAVFVIRLDAKDVSMGINDMKGFSKVGQLDKWLSDNLGIPVIIGLLAFWEDNSDEKITAYVPDVDGQIRRGAY
jgi:hypothetical protein